jgi:hypothetical protein
MPYVKNKFFIPVNQSKAKDTIVRPTVHDEERFDFSQHRSTVLGSKKKVKNYTG